MTLTCSEIAKPNYTKRKIIYKCAQRNRLPRRPREPVSTKLDLCRPLCLFSTCSLGPRVRDSFLWQVVGETITNKREKSGYIPKNPDQMRRGKNEFARSWKRGGKRLQNKIILLILCNL